MDLLKVIQALYHERMRLDGAIEALEGVLDDGSESPDGKQPKRRGRKSMNSEERAKVSERMRKYWAAKRRKAAMEAHGAA